MKSITDKAEVSIDFPDKAYMGTFGRSSLFEVQADSEEVLLKLLRPGSDRREVALHIHYFLLADILTEMAQALSSNKPLDQTHCEPMCDAADALVSALRQTGKKQKRRGRPKRQ